MAQQQYSTTISQIYKSRNVLLELLDKQGYDIRDYEEFSVNEVHIMNNNKQLDMMLNNNSKSNNKKVYVKYHLAKTIRRENINDYVDDLFNIDEVLDKKNDTLVIIIKQEPNDTIVSVLNQIWEQEGIFIVMFNIARLQFNILKHSWVPKHRIMDDEEIEDLKKDYNIVDMKQIPVISRYDPVALAIGMKPGQVCKIERPSKTAIISNYYRFCSQ